VLPAAGARTPSGVLSVRTGDRDADGRIDRVVLRFGSAGAARRASRSVRVAGYRVRRVRLRGTEVLVTLRAHPGPDSGARPLVRWRRAARMPADGAPPVPVAARGRGVSGRVLIVWSEPVRYSRRGLSGFVDATGGPLVPLGVTAAGARTLALDLAAGSAPATVRLRRGAVRDLSGNLARASRPLRVARAHAHAPGAGSLPDPIDPVFQRDLAFGQRSDWLQPWRAYLDTVPASRFRAALGIGFPFAAGEAAGTARLIAGAGFRRARLEVPWGDISYDDPARFTPAHEAELRALLQTFRDAGIRPLLLLNANEGEPGPTRRFAVDLAAPARAGDGAITVSSADGIVPGLSGLAEVTKHESPEIFFTAVDGDQVTLSRPLPVDLAAGTHAAAAVRYAPFRRPLRADGTPDPGFQRTLGGWLAYVAATTRLAGGVMGPAGYDIEIWNERSFGSDFLDVDNYYDPPADAGRGDQVDVLLRRTVDWLRDPVSGVPAGVGITDGFASQVPWPSGATSVAGLTALSKHPYGRQLTLPAQAPQGAAVDAVGRAEPGGSFTPAYATDFPEYYLTAIQTEHLVRELSPLETAIGDVPHGRSVAAPGGAPVEVWLTEAGLAADGVPATALPHLKAKVALRTLTAWAAKGAGVVDLYTDRSAEGPFGLVDPAAPGGGDVLRAVGRLTAAVGDGTPARRRSLSLLGVADVHGHRQFDGDCTAAHPPLYDRDVLAFFPFQAANDRFVVAVYVMTRDVRRELAPERFTLAIGGVHGNTARVSATDPLTGGAAAARVVSRSSEGLTVSFPATDSVRLLTLEDA